jgi:hypothetical protein
MKSRRQFIIDCSTGAAALALGSVNSASALGGEFQTLANLAYPALANQVNSLFWVRVSACRSVKIKLISAPLSAPDALAADSPLPADAGNERFSLIFTGPGDRLIESAIHRFEHPLLGKFDMYIGQFGLRCGKIVRYESVFNRPTKAC